MAFLCNGNHQYFSLVAILIAELLFEQFLIRTAVQRVEHC